MRTISAIGSNQQECRRAFTLIELSIVVFIVALVLAVSVPTFVRSYNSALLSETARTLATTAQLARFQAVSRQQPSAFHIDLDRQAVWVTQVDTNAEAGGGLRTLRKHQLPSRVRIVSVEHLVAGNDHGRQIQLQFYPNGTCDPATFVLRGNERGGLGVALDPITCQAASYVIR